MCILKSPISKIFSVMTKMFIKRAFRNSLFGRTVDTENDGGSWSRQLTGSGQHRGDFPVLKKLVPVLTYREPASLARDTKLADINKSWWSNLVQLHKDALLLPSLQQTKKVQLMDSKEILDKTHFVCEWAKKTKVDSVVIMASCSVSRPG